MKWQSLILPSLFFSIRCFASLCLTWCSQSFQLQSLQQKELARSASTAERSLQQKELARSASTAERSLQQKELASLHQLELPHLGAAVKRFQLPRAQLYSTEKTALESFQLTTAQLCRTISSFQAADPRTVVRKAAFQETGTAFQTGACRSIPFRSAAFKTLFQQSAA